jgi:hypothetical protein
MPRPSTVWPTFAQSAAVADRRLALSPMPADPSGTPPPLLPARFRFKDWCLVFKCAEPWIES